jgi:tetratricopeptide (TPR) repeat protein
MESPFEKNLRANDLRKSGNYIEALTLYRELYQENPNQFASAGYLHCLRKLKYFQEAIPLADSLVGKFPEFDWVNNEIIWTYIEGLLYNIPEEESLSVVISVAKRILNLQPNQLASNLTIMRVCKTAKNEKKWKMLHEWIQKVDPASLDQTPKLLPNGREGWSQQGLWYLYRITALVENGMSDEAFPFLEYAIEHFPKQKKFFLRLRAQAYSDEGKKEEAADDYKKLCDVPRPDWWMLKEYADILIDLGHKEDALALMLQAAQSKQDPGLMVGLFEAIGDLFYGLGNKEYAALHYQLTKLIREKREWKIPGSLDAKLAELSSAGIVMSGSIQDVFQKCHQIWRHQTEKPGVIPLKKPLYQDDLRRNLIGKISLGRPDRPFCFINLMDGDSVFCFKDLLPPGINDGDEVIVDARPSWDQKKNKQSWKAQNIRLQKK